MGDLYGHLEWQVTLASHCKSHKDLMGMIYCACKMNNKCKENVKCKSHKDLMRIFYCACEMNNKYKEPHCNQKLSILIRRIIYSMIHQPQLIYIGIKRHSLKIHFFCIFLMNYLWIIQARLNIRMLHNTVQEI